MVKHRPTNMANERAGIQHSLGDKYTVLGVECTVRYVNGEYAFLFPVKDVLKLSGHKHPSILAYARINPDGVLTLL